MSFAKGFAGAITFLTKIPFPWHPDIHQEKFSDIAAYFPWVGAVLGVLIWGGAFLGNWIFGSEVNAILVVFFLVVLTGGLHMDGIADTFDGLLSYREKDRILEIMKDSRIGTHGVLAVFFILGFKTLFIFEIIKSGYFPILILMPVAGRMMLVLACYKGVNARQEGMGRSFIGTIKDSVFYIALLNTAFILGICNFFLPFSAAICSVGAVFVAALFTLGFRKYVYGVIQGITGDVLGAICEMSECIFLMVFLIGAVLWKLFI